jgi:hypothetical protein
VTIPFAYDDARALFARFVPSQLFSASGEAAPENAYATYGQGGGYTPPS